jgi:hypothetical protein
MPTWPAWSLSGASAAAPARTQPAARVRHRPPTDQPDVGSVARVPASATVDRAVDGPAATGASTGSGGQGRPASSTWPPTPPPEHGRRTRPDRRGRHQTAGHRTGGQQTAGHRTGGQRTAERRTRWTTIPGDRTPDGWTAGSRTPRPEGWTPLLDTGDRRRGVAAGRVDHGDDARPGETGWTLLGADAVRASTNQDRAAARTPRAPTLPRTGLATAATSAAGGTPPSSWRLGALLSSNEFWVERRANGEASSVMQASTDQRCRKQRFGTESGSWWGACA